MSRLASAMLLFTAAVCGAVVMAVELLGARLLGVVFGGSLAVWAAMIAVTLLSLAAGYFMGGWLSDRRPKAAILYGALVAAAVLIVICPHAGPVVRACRGAMGLQAGALVSSALVFSLPLVLLGMTSPFIIRLLCAEGRGVGIRAGGVYAVSTLGSVAGTLATGLWLIPAFGTPAGFRITAVALAAAGAVGLVVSLGVKGSAGFVAPLLLAILPVPSARIGSSYKAPDGETVELCAVRDSAHGHIVVLEKGRYRLLVVNGIIQTGIPRDLAGLTQCQGLSSDYFQELLPYTVDEPRGKKVLVVGLAGGMTAALLRLYDMQLDCVDLDPEIIAVAREHFGFTGRAVAADGRQFLEDCRPASYDFCVMDTYSGDVFPFHLATREAFEAARRALRPDGVLAINYIGEPGGRAFASFHRTLKEVFPHVRAIRGEPGQAAQTITLFASAREIGFNKLWMDRLGGAGTGGADPVSERIRSLEIDPAGLAADAVVLTDSYNPIDSLRTREALRWRERTAENIGQQALFY